MKQVAPNQQDDLFIDDDPPQPEAVADPPQEHEVLAEPPQEQSQ
ncbi:MAG: hypothetical protein ACKPKO_44860 [Candidatus Fonsibacter sp.]